ncbi:hypothetical protein APA_5139 [Pseudanabaena sp. lw0831]|uniref:hypothetical protein n=1 Tax=Pseudanabaena sp. lw0831 TaxID=1357935 RepID=UPI001915F962|nr:hypothetical protein [Pseudanabaena sp. lw0831]GBO56804.1 hypothetical protein APA_5139 [Pseudanabaena sp. lw0831]
MISTWSTLRHIPTWSTLRRLGENKSVRSANIWAIVVPISAKLLERVQGVVTVELFGHKFPINLTLPFSWKVLFFAAIFFLLANIIFAIWCPKLIKETETYREFADQQRSIYELEVQFKGLEKAGLLSGDTIPQWLNWFSSHRQVTLSKRDDINGVSIENEGRELKEIYQIIVESLAKKNTPARLFASLFYFFGVALTAIIIIQNIMFVALHW